MIVAAAAATAMSAAALGVARFLAARRREGGKLLGDFRGTAMRAFRPLPVGGADEDFAVVFALFAMKFVNRHEWSITGAAAPFKLVLQFQVCQLTYGHAFHRQCHRKIAAAPQARGVPRRRGAAHFAGGAAVSRVPAPRAPRPR